MKKFISMVMAAAMVVTMVPATAFALDGDVTAEAKVLKAVELNESNTDIDLTTVLTSADVPEIRVKATDVAWKNTTDNDSSVDFKIELDNAVWKASGAQVTETEFENMVTVICGAGTASAPITATGPALGGTISDFSVNAANNTVKFKFTHCDASGVPCAWHEDDVLYINLDTVMTKTNPGDKATVSVKCSDIGVDLKDAVFASVVEKGIKAELEDDVVDVAVEEVEFLEDIVLTPTVGTTFNDVKNKTWTAADPEEITLKLSKGFEFVFDGTATITSPESGTYTLVRSEYNDNVITLAYTGWCTASSEMVLDNLKVEATTAKPGDVATVTVKIDGLDAVKVEVAKVIENAVVMSVDADEDVPTFYNGVNVANTGLTVDDDHVSLEVTLEETFAGVWSMHKDFTLSLPEGVHVTAVSVDDENSTFTTPTGAQTFDGNLYAAFEAAYREGDHEFFEFNKRTFNETDPDRNQDPHKMTFTLTLVAEPDFVGDVVLKLEGAAVDTQEVVIAKVLAPYTIKAEQNDLIIDYRYTSVDTDIVITEAEAGLWDENLTVAFAVERGDMIQFEDDATFTVNSESGMEIDDEYVYTGSGTTALSNMGFVVDEESDEEAAVITISDIELFMQRNIPAGPYDLDVIYNSATEAFLAQPLFAPDHTGACTGTTTNHSGECVVNNVDDFSTTVHEAWVNVVTAGRDQDDASFTTKVVVPVGESYIVAGDKQIALDVPAYINADGYTMLPVRAVATALGINNDAVQWNQATKTVIIMYGQRIITMTAGQSVVYVSGTAIPAASSVEIVNGRAFLGLRDLATTLGVATINWDPATKVASLN